ncbi:MAG: DUF5060 domain-containing protein [Planctomycetes bacterium]|nr:DUF5060 domain-containing protein [Planctomycetota bacterium]
MKTHRRIQPLVLVALLSLFPCPLPAADSTAPIAAPDLVFDEVEGIVAVEAEHFYKQTLTDKRAWHITSSVNAPDLKPDPDPPHVAGASGGAYLEILPDTRANHGQKLIDGENFSGKPGVMTVAHYKVNIKTPGRYYVWVRSFSTGSEDNGVHVGLNGQWPESGQRWQTVQKNTWAWDCRQRTEQVHVGVPMQLFLDIEKAGEHEIMFSLREDGFEMDKFILASDKEFKPEGKGPAVKVKAGTLPAAFPEAAEAAAAAKVAAPAKPAAAVAPVKPLTPLVQPRQPDGPGTVVISGELKEWHKVTLTLDGPYAHERDNEPNPFTDCNLTVTFTHDSGSPSYKVPGYFAADGNAGESSAEMGTKWGTLMAGGAGVEYYFGYQLPQNDLNCEDFRSRDKSWDYCRIALDFFRDNRIPFWEMKNADALIGNEKNDNSKFCFAKAGELYLVYLPEGGETPIDLAGASGKFSLKWFNPREGGAPQASGNATLNGGSTATLTAPSADDWLAVIARE